jgi:hypothetical protein
MNLMQVQYIVTRGAVSAAGLIMRAAASFAHSRTSATALVPDISENKVMLLFDHFLDLPTVIKDKFLGTGRCLST